MYIDKLKIPGWLLLISLVISIFHGFYPVGGIVLSGILSVCAAFFFVSPLDQNSKITGCCVVFHWAFININEWRRDLSSPW